MAKVVPEYMHTQPKHINENQKNPKPKQKAQTQNHVNVTQHKNLNQLFRRKLGELFQLLQKSLYVSKKLDL